MQWGRNSQSLHLDSCSVASQAWAYLDPKVPTFLGFLDMISLYKSLKRVGYLGFR